MSLSGSPGFSGYLSLSLYSAPLGRSVVLSPPPSDCTPSLKEGLAVVVAVHGPSLLRLFIAGGRAVRAQKGGRKGGEEDLKWRKDEKRSVE